MAISVLWLVVRSYYLEYVFYTQGHVISLELPYSISESILIYYYIAVTALLVYIYWECVTHTVHLGDKTDIKNPSFTANLQ